jgi:hypothetical protein
MLKTKPPKKSKKAKKPIIPERRPTEVGVWRDCCHYLLVSPTNKRIQAWKETREYAWGKIISSAAETITVADLLTLLAIVKHAQDYPQDTTETLSDNGSKLFLNVHMTQNQLFSAIGNHDKRAVIGDLGDDGTPIRMGSIMRLRTWVVQYWDKRDTNPVDQQYFYKYSLNTHEPSIFSISRDFYKWCCDGEHIDLELMKRIKSPTAQALYLYLRGNRTNRRPYLATIVRALGLSTDTKRKKYEAKTAIINAFERLKELNVVKPDFSESFYFPKRQQFVWFMAFNFFGGRTFGYSATPDHTSVLSDWIFDNGCFPTENQE